MSEKEYIEKELVMDTIDELKLRTLPKTLLFDHLKKVIEVFPTESIAPVKHGHWVEQSDCDELVCSCCNGGYTLYDETPYCPNCGAKMDEDNTDD